MSTARNPHGVPQLVSERDDGTQATAHVTSQEEGRAVDSLHHQFQELQRDERLDAEQVSQIKAFQDEVLSRPMECHQLDISSSPPE